MAYNKDILKWRQLVEAMDSGDEMMYCPTCGWKGPKSALKNGRCPECGAPVVPLKEWKKKQKKEEKEAVAAGDESASEEERENAKMQTGTKKASEKDVIAFLKDHPNPDDDDVHDWATEKGYEIHGLEKIFYKLATKYVEEEEEEESEEEEKD
jgi:hypothetical protein